MMWVLLAALGGAAIWYATQGHLGARKLECPSCDLYIHGVRLVPSGAVLCPHCRAYASVEQNKLVKTPTDRIANQPVFCVELLQHTQWPDACCVCGNPPTRNVEVKLVIEQNASMNRDLAVGVASLGVLKAIDRTTYTVGVPHCEEHDDGAELVPPFEPDQVNMGVSFRSYPYFTRFVQQNRTIARKQSAWGPSAGG